MITASAPGKLYIAGEYAVLEPGQPAILVALDQYITVSLEKAKNQGSIRSSYSNGFTIPWTRKNGRLYIDERENPFSYVAQAVTTTESYLAELGKKLNYFDLEIESDLDNQDGRKYGLGSSGAVTIATIKALLMFHEITFDSTLVYKLAAITHLSIKSNGSFGDLAASSYGGWIAYSCFDREWVKKQLTKMSLVELVATDWPSLRIEPLTPPTNLNLLIGWTGSPASTTLLVDLLNQEIKEIDDCYTTFLAKSKQCVNKIIAAFKAHDFKAIQQGLRENRQLLQALGKNSGVRIETGALFELCEIAEEFGAAGKSSGAGGGDCGIVLIDKQTNPLPLINKWQQAGISYLDVAVHYEESYLFV